MIFNKYQVILIDGSGDGGDEMVVWLNNHRDALENYVENGGRVWLNIATSNVYEELETVFGVYWNRDCPTTNVTCAPGAGEDQVYRYPHEVNCEMWGIDFGLGCLSATASDYNYEILTVDSIVESVVVLLRIKVGLGGEVMYHLLRNSLSKIFIGTQTFPSFQEPFPQVVQFRENQFWYLVNGSTFIVQ